MLAQIHEQSRHIQERDQHIETNARDFKFKGAKVEKVEKVTFELGWLKTGRLSSKTQSMNAEPRQVFEDALAEDRLECV